MEIQGKNKAILTVVILLIIVGWTAYVLYFRTPEVQVVLDEFGNPVATQVKGQDLINLLDELQAVRFDESFFGSGAFLSLFDFAIELRPQPLGRKNPFEAIGR